MWIQPTKQYLFLFNWQIDKNKYEEATKIALEVGFRHIDGAYVYETEEQVGRAVREKIADGTVKREDIFYTGKVSEFEFYFFFFFMNQT